MRNYMYLTVCMRCLVTIEALYVLLLFSLHFDTAIAELYFKFRGTPEMFVHIQNKWSAMHSTQYVKRKTGRRLFYDPLKLEGLLPRYRRLLKVDSVHYMTADIVSWKIIVRNMAFTLSLYVMYSTIVMEWFFSLHKRHGYE